MFGLCALRLLLSVSFITLLHCLYLSKPCQYRVKNISPKQAYFTYLPDSGPSSYLHKNQLVVLRDLDLDHDSLIIPPAQKVAVHYLRVS